MRAYDLAIFIVLFAAVMGILDDSLQFTGGNVEMGEATFNKADFNDTPEVDNSGDSILGWGDKLYESTFGWLAFLKTVVGRVFYIQDLIATVFGGSEEAHNIAWVIQAGIYMVYGIGFFQAVSGRNVKGME